MNVTPSLYESLQARFDIATIELEVGGRRYDLVKPRNADDLLDEEEFEFDDRIPYWADLWPSARVLAERLADTSGDGKSLIELGCGLGLCSLVAAGVGYQALATDYYDDALQFVTLNAERSSLPPLATRMVDWRDMPTDLGQFDRVVAADVLYERPYADLVAKTIRSVLAPDGEAVVTDPGRRVAAEFPQFCQNHGLAVIDHDRVPWQQDAVTVTIDVYRLRHA